MLVIDLSVNRVKYIDSILIQRIKTGTTGNNTYKIVRPEGFERIEIKHQYNDGALKLLKKALDIIITECDKCEKI